MPFQTGYNGITMATSREDQIRAFLAAKGATKCPPTASHADNAPSLHRMRAARERALSAPVQDECPTLEQRSERSMERFHAARAGGASMSDALDYMTDNEMDRLGAVDGVLDM